MWTISDEQMAAITESLVEVANQIGEGNTTQTTDPVLPCEQVEVVSITVGSVTPKAEPKILSAVWKKNSGEREKINILEYEQKCFIEIKTQGFNDEDELTLEIKENIDNATILKIINLKIKNNEAQTESEDDKALTADEDWRDKQLIIKVSSKRTDNFEGDKINVACCEKHLKLKDKGNFIEEIAIRLCGFGGIQPYNEINVDITKAVIQFQKDYMKVAETGLICIHVLKSLDKFMDEYKIDVNQLKCTCKSDGENVFNYISGTNDLGSCVGFGNVNDRKLNHYIKYVVVKPKENKKKIKKKVSENGVEIEKEIEEVDYETTHTIEQEYSKYVIEFNYNAEGKEENHKWVETNKDRKITTAKHIKKLRYDISQSQTDTNLLSYEHPGMHRSLMWAYKALAFYIDKEYKDSANKFTINKINSGYRCHNQETYRQAKGGRTHNHMGTALDIHFNLNGERTQKTTYMDTIRTDICKKYLGAHLGWLDKKLGLESARDGATSWVHIDCREFRKYKSDKFFKETESDINGGKLVDIVKNIDEGKFKHIIDSE